MSWPLTLVPTGCRASACLPPRSAGRPVAVAALRPGEPSWTDGQTISRRCGRGRPRRARGGCRAGVDDRRRQPGPRRGAAPGSVTLGWPGATWRSRGTAHWSPTPSAAGRLGIAGRPRHRAVAAIRPPLRWTWRPVNQPIDDPPPEFGVIRAAKVTGRERTGGQTTRRGKPGARPADGATGAQRTGGTRRRRDRRLRRSRSVHQPGRWRRFHRQVAEEDAVLRA